MRSELRGTWCVYKTLVYKYVPSLTSTRPNTALSHVGPLSANFPHENLAPNKTVAPEPYHAIHAQQLHLKEIGLNTHEAKLS